MLRRWKLLSILATLLIVALVGVGCLATAPHAVETYHLSGPYRVEVYRGGRLVKESELVVGSADERAVATWLASHREGWQPSFVSYAPGRMICGDGFNLNLRPGGLCVLNYGLNVNPQQVVRQVSASETEALMAATGGE